MVGDQYWHDSVTGARAVGNTGVTSRRRQNQRERRRQRHEADWLTEPLTAMVDHAAGPRMWLLLSALPAFLAIDGGVIVTVAGAEKPDVPEFFPELEGDMTKVTWAHAVNSQKKLDAALSGNVMMLEADIVMGTTNDTINVVPIMAHPPNNHSDLSFESFLKQVYEKNVHKGIKLDFKSSEAFNKSVDILKKIDDKLLFPVWLNADILPGPINALGAPVNATIFLNTCYQQFPNRTISAGWNTTSEATNNDGYSEDQLASMVDLLKKTNISLSKHLTLPLRASFAAYSTETLLPVLRKELPNATITLWSSETDTVNGTLLLQLVESIGKTRVYMDLPEKIHHSLVLSSSAINLKSATIPIFIIIQAFVLYFSNLF